MELSKYIKSESVELNRSAIHFADYNPRKLSEESRKTLKRGIKKFGLVGGIVVNKRTGLTVVSGHQRLSVMDELQKFPENDYKIRVDVLHCMGGQFLRVCNIQITCRDDNVGIDIVAVLENLAFCVHGMCFLPYFRSSGAQI